MPASAPAILRAFRTDLHRCCSRRADALFELGDALMPAGPVISLPYLSLQAVHRRGWGSRYDALADETLDVVALQGLLTRQAAADGPAVYAIDRSIWPRRDAEASPKRGSYDNASRHSAGQPIVAGWAYQWLAQLSFTRDSWTRTSSPRPASGGPFPHCCRWWERQPKRQNRVAAHRAGRKGADPGVPPATQP
jgi:hypothetical protein